MGYNMTILVYELYYQNTFLAEKSIFGENGTSQFYVEIYSRNIKMVSNKECVHP